MNCSSNGRNWVRMVRTSLTLLFMLVRGLPVVGSVSVLNMVLLGLLPPVGIWVLERTTTEAEEIVVGRGSPNALITWLALLAVVQGLESLLQQIHIWVNSFSQEEFRRNLQRRLMEKGQRLKLEYFEKTQFFELQMRARRSIDGGDFFLMMIRLADSVSWILTLVFLSGVMAMYDPRLLVPVIIAGLPVFYSRTREGRRRYALHKDQIQDSRIADYLSRLQTDRSAAKELRLCQTATYLRERWFKLAHRIADCRVGLARRQSLRNAVVDCGSQIAFAAGLLYGVWLTIEGSLVIPAFVALAEALRRFQKALFDLLTQSGQQYERILRFSDLLLFLELPHDENSEGEVLPSKQTRGIAVNGVSFAYPGHSALALNDVTFTIHPGESVALVGSNGAGKSTMIRLILGLYQPTKGEITLDGVPLDGINPRSLRANTSSVFQDFMRYHLKLRHNIGFGKLALLNDDKEILRAAERGGAAAVIDRLGNIERMLGTEFADGTDLSGGEWQRIAISRSFMREVPVVVLDEPTASLDPLAEADVFGRFARLSVDSTTILVSHRLGSARLVDRILVFDQGFLVEQGSHKRLLSEDGIYARLWRKQAQWYRRNTVSGEENKSKTGTQTRMSKSN